MNWSKSETTYDVGSQIAIAAAKAGGFEVTFSDEKTLLIDIDSEQQYETFQNRLSRLDEMTDYEMNKYVSVSGLPHRHVIISTVQGFNIMERLFLQLFLGSDPIREFISYLRVLEDDANPSMLVKDGKV